MRKLFAGLLVLALVVTGIGMVEMAGAHGGSAGRGYRQQDVQRQSDNPLDLSEEQLDSLDQAREEFFETRDELRQELFEANQELRELHFNNGETEEIEALQGEINELRAKLSEDRNNYWTQMSEILTEEQLEQLEEGRQEFSGRFNNNQRLNRPGFGGRRPGNYGHRGQARPMSPGFCY